MAPCIATDPSVVLCGYGRVPRLPGTIYSHRGHMGLQHFLNCMYLKYIFILKNTFKGVREYCGGMDVTYKVRSLGMWLKLETGMLLMLLLFSVL